MKIINYIVFVFCFLVTISCKKLIEVDAPNDQINSVQVFEDSQTAYSALSGLYFNLLNQSILSGNNYGMGALLGSYTDDLDCYYNDLNGFNAIAMNQQQATNTVVQTTWNISYQQIYQANAIIYGVDNSSSLSEIDKKQIRGEALLIRSMLYFYLQRIYGEIPYTTSLDYEYNRKLGKTSEQNLLLQLEKDLTLAVELLGENYRNPERIYPNGKVAQLLLGQIYLVEHKYKEAEQVAGMILQSTLYRFESDLNEVFHKDGKHILWQLKPQYSGDPANEASFYYFSDSAPLTYALTGDLINSFSDDDLRKTSWIEIESFRGKQWSRANKYKNLSGTNFNEYSIVFRLEEVYFMMAEALVKQNKLSDAEPYLNATRQRAGLSVLHPSTEETFLDEILKEKRREFFTEQGIRFMDLKRTGKLAQLAALKPNWSSYKSVWPYPQNELLLNPKLKPQNEKY